MSENFLNYEYFSNFEESEKIIFISKLPRNANGKSAKAETKKYL